MSGRGPRLISVSRSGLPKGYTKLEYIENTGSQYINTGFKPNNNTRIVMKIGGAPKSKEQHLFGSRTSTSASDKFSFLTTANGRYRSDFYNSNADVATSFDFSGVFTVDKNKEKCYLNGLLAATNTNGTFSGGYPIYLFAINTGGTAGMIKSGTQLYSCQIYDNGILARDFIPCKNPSGVVGMYDTVGGTFYTNAGSGAFTAG